MLRNLVGSIEPEKSGGGTRVSVSSSVAPAGQGGIVNVELEASELRSRPDTPSIGTTAVLLCKAAVKLLPFLMEAGSTTRKRYSESRGGSGVRTLAPERSRWDDSLFAAVATSSEG